MKKNSISKLITITLVLFSIFVYGQEEKATSSLKVNAGADLVSRYVWRGIQLGGNSPNIQPSISLNYNNLEIGAWGAYSLGGVSASQEMDLYVSYALSDMFSCVLTDYYFPDESSDYRYFKYGEGTGHVLEAGLSFNGTEKIPLNLSAYMNFYGGDASTIGSESSDSLTFNKVTGIQYSNYFELGYAKTISGLDCNLFMGFTLSNPKVADTKTGFLGETGFYGDGAGIINVGISAQKSLQISNKYTLPITASLITNPQAEKVYFVFGFSF